MRYVVSPVVGTGTRDDPYRAKVADYGSHVAVIPGNPDGTPASTWALSGVLEESLTAIDGDAECVLFPDLAVDEVITPDLIPIGRGTVDMPNFNEWAFLTLGEAVESTGQQLDTSFTIDSMRL